MKEFDRAEAIADLILNPAGSVRIWADRWGWHRRAVERFLSSLERDHVMTFERGKTGTRAAGCPGVSRPKKWTTGTLNPESGDPTEGVPGVPATLENYREQITTDSRGGTPYAERLIAEMNRVLGQSIGETYEPVSADQRGSHRAAQKLEAANVPLEFALEQLAEDCRNFNPGRHGKGKDPRSLAFFAPWILRDWNRRAQLNLGLPPKLTVSPVARPVVALATAESRKPTPISAVDWRSVMDDAIRERKRV